jgi:hypothetical protein
MRLRSSGLSLLVCTAVVSGCVWLSGNRAPIYNVVDAPLDNAGTVEQVGEKIRRAARMMNWKIEEVRPNFIYVTKRRGEHTATAAISYDADSFSIQIRSSDYLKQGEDGRIHKLYNEWVHSLESTIRRELASGY